MSLKVFLNVTIIVVTIVNFGLKLLMLQNDLMICLVTVLILFEFSFMIKCYCCPLVAQSCPTLCDPMDCSTPGFLVLHRLSELAQTHVH